MGPIYDPNQLIGNIYPNITSDAHYVFFTSLFHKNPPGPEIAQFAAEYLHSTILISETKHATSYVTNSITIDNVLSFLDTLIQNELSKEMAFLQYIGKIKNIDIEIPTLNDNWDNFIIQVQRITQMGQMGLDNLKLEYERLLSNSTRVANYYDKYKNGNMSLEELQQAQQGYQRSINSATTEQLKKVISFLNGEDNATGKAIVNYILKTYKEKLFVFNNNQLVLNQTALTNTIVGISHILLERYNSIKASIQTLEKNTKPERKERFNIGNDFETRIQMDKELTDEINHMLELENLPFVTTDISKLYKIETSNRMNRDFSQLTDIIQSRADANESIWLSADELQGYFSQRSLKQNITLKLVSNKNTMSEIRETVSGLLSGAFHGSQIGYINAKTDELLAYLEINFPGSDDKQIKKINTTLQQARQKLETLEQGFSQKNDYKYYLQREQDWNKAITEIKKLIDNLAKELDILINCYIVENSTKSYESLLVRKFDENKKDFFEFSGGSQGNISEALTKINAMSNAGGLTFTDINWLLNACINAGPGMIGSDNLHNLESYFSAIAAILLFDNQLGIINEAFSKQPQTSGTNVKQIHLFSINSGTYPLSYILKLTRDHLQKVYTEALSTVNNGAQATITGFVSHPDTFDPSNNKKMTPESWSSLSAAAISQVKIEVTFLAGFLGILNNFMHINN